jgi:hypothetical protein
MKFVPLDILYSSEAFTLYRDKVIQGKNTAIAHSDVHISSNYRSPVSETFSRLINFKFSINEKDNELPFGVNHQILIGDEHESPVITFGQMPANTIERTESFLPANYSYTFKVDMTPVISQFEEKGYYENYNGVKIAKSDFKGFYIAGGSEPLSWDFVGLGGKGLKLEPSGDGHIYTITVIFNPYDPSTATENHWNKSWDTSDKPSYKSDQPIVDALFNMTLEEAKKNIEADSTFRTGAKWGGVWTRDISYSIFLAFAYHEPEIAKISLMKKVSRDRIIQDTGSGGAWPVSSDRTTWALAAWEIYKVTGDKEWLKKVYIIIKNTLADDAKTLFSASGLYKGESSFLDWREQTYPKWMNNKDIYISENLGTNVVHFQAHKILASMAAALGEPFEEYEKKADGLKNAINTQLWMSEKGYYAQYKYGRKDLINSPRFEALGEALAVLFDVADDFKSREIFEKSPVTDYGATCIYPQIPGIPPYHNNAVWPFVQSFWNLAAAKTGNEKALSHGLSAIYRAGGLFLSNYENFVGHSGDFKGTEINSDRMLWSMAGNLAMVHRLFMGMSFGIHGIKFNPVIPKVYGGTKTLNGFKYREAVLNIKVIGYGRNIKTFAINGKKMKNAYLDAQAKGVQNIEIVMDNIPFDQMNFTPVANHFSLPNPVAILKNDTISWAPIPGAISYFIYKNGFRVNAIMDTKIGIPSDDVAEYMISAVDEKGYESFASEPILITNQKNVQTVQIEDFTEKSSLPYSDFTGQGFVEISTELNTNLSIDIEIAHEGTYLIDVRYANGSGPWNSENKCAIRSLYSQEEFVGSLVLPQRGTDEWSDWGYSNAISLPLKKGKNKLSIRYESWNTNMNIIVNRAMLDFIRLIRVSD